MRINIRKMKHSWDLVLTQDANEIVLAYPDEKACRVAACEIRDTAMASLGEVQDWEFLPPFSRK